MIFFLTRAIKEICDLLSSVTRAPCYACNKLFTKVLVGALRQVVRTDEAPGRDQSCGQPAAFVGGRCSSQGHSLLGQPTAMRKYIAQCPQPLRRADEAMGAT